MAIRLMDGFDIYGVPLSSGPSFLTTLIKNYTSVSSDIIRAVQGRYGNSHALSLLGSKNDTTIKQTVSSAGVTSFIVGFNFYMPTLINTTCDFMITNGTVNTARGIRIYAASTLVDPTIYLNNTSMGTIARNTWHHIEAVIVLSGTSELFVNGVSVGTTTNSMSYDGMFTIYRSAGNNNDTCYIDDYYVLDNTGSLNNSRIGSASYVPRIETLMPRSDVSSQWTVNGTTLGASNITETFETYGTQTLAASASTFEANTGTKIATIGQLYTTSATNTAYAGTEYLLIGRNNLTTINQSKLGFTTIANSVSFYVKSDAYFSNPTITFYITINDTRTAYTANSTWTLVTLSLSKYSTIIIETDPANTTNYSFCIDNITFSYASQTTSIAIKAPENSSINVINGNLGDLFLCNLDDLSTIKSVKAASIKVHNGFTTSTTTEKLIGNSNTEFGSTITSNQASFSGNWTTQYFETNPVSGDNWTESNVNSFQLGLIKKT